MTDTHTYKPDPIADLNDLAQIMENVVEQMRPSFTTLAHAITTAGEHLSNYHCPKASPQRTTKAERRCAKHLLAHRRRTNPAAPKVGIAEAARQYRAAPTQGPAGLTWTAAGTDYAHGEAHGHAAGA